MREVVARPAVFVDGGMTGECGAGGMAKLTFLVMSSRRVLLLRGLLAVGESGSSSSLLLAGKAAASASARVQAASGGGRREPLGGADTRGVAPGEGGHVRSMEGVGGLLLLEAKKEVMAF